MTRKYTYTENKELWAAENRAKAAGWEKTSDCYWCQIFRKGEDEVITSREDEGTPVNIAEAFTAEREQEAPAEAQEPAEKDYFREGYYNYLEAIVDDVKDYIRNEIDLQDFTDRDELEEYLNDELWTADSVTGNASGSYYCNTWKAEEALCHNWDLLAEALQEFGSTVDVLQEGAEALDVTIRCYLLGQAIAEALDDMEVFDNE